jgi:Telomere resolvase
MPGRAWLEDEIQAVILPKLEKLRNTPKGRAHLEAFVLSIRDGWTVRGILQQPLMDRVRRVIKDELGEEHWSLEIFNFSRDEYFEINRGKQEKARKRQQSQGFIDPEQITSVAVRLLGSQKWAEVATAIAVLTGRRLNEILKTGGFSVKSQWVVSFQGSLKRRDDPIVFDVPTLTTARKVVDAVNRLREITPPGADERAVSVASEKHFSGLVTPPGDNQSLYTHLWRSVYATIATFWFCPPTVDDLLFKAHIMGHFEALPEAERDNPAALANRLESFSSERHYRLFEISDEVIAQHQGKRKGIKLGHAGITPIEAFNALPEPDRERKSTAVTSLRIFKADADRWATVLDKLGGEGNQPQRTEALLDWIEQRLVMESGDSMGGDRGMEVIEVEREGVEVRNQMPMSLPSTGVEDPLRQDIRDLVGVLALLVENGAIAPSRTTAAADPGAGGAQRAVAPAIAPSLPQPPSSEHGEKRTFTKRPTQESITQLHSCINAIMTYNNAPDRPHEHKWAVNLSILKKLGCSQRQIPLILDERKQEIEHHHRIHQINPDSHNLYHRGKDDLRTLISF